MKYKAWRGTKLSEAVKILENKFPHKYLYRITNIEEAKDYALVSKWDDRSSKGAVIEAEISFPKKVAKFI